MTTIIESPILKLGGCDPARVVLRHDKDAYMPWVVHFQVFPPEEGREPFYVDGGYYQDLAEAAEDYGRRVLRERRAFEREQGAAA